MEYTWNLLKEAKFPIKGTTRLHIGDPDYFEEIKNGTDNKNLKKVTFDGNISAAPKGIMHIRLWEVKDNSLSWNTLTVDVYQGNKLDIAGTYCKGSYYPKGVKTDCELGCDSASFEIETKFGYDKFYTGASGYYGELKAMKQYYGMILHLDFDDDLYDFDEIVQRMKALWPESKNKDEIDFVNA